ncbi:MAG: DNA mismatch repair protein MutS [Fibrobacteres bacterium]|nr:DNA mismatch repair protein MutS [Fibrobacterota bacterium]
MSTPLMKQYHRIKSENSGAVLLFRMGDFYEMFDEDAIIASKVLGIALTSRNHGEASKTPLCGFPYHALDRYCARLVAAGHKVAVCEQTSDPKAAKGIVERDIVEVITRGTATNPEVLKDKVNNYIAAVIEHKGVVGLAGADVSTGEFFCGEAPPQAALREIEKMAAVEILYGTDDRREAPPAFLKYLAASPLFTPVPAWRFSKDAAVKALTAHFKTTTLEGFGVDNLDAGLMAANALFEFIREQKKGRVDHIRKISPLITDRSMALDGSTIRNLEILNPLNPEDVGGTLLAVVDRTKSAMGGRLLKRLLVNPLRDAAAIRERQDTIELFLNDPGKRDKIRTLLGSLSDIERLSAKIGYERATPRDLHNLKTSFYAVQQMLPILTENSQKLTTEIANAMSGTEVITEHLEKALVDEPPLSISDGGAFRKGYNHELDAIIDGAADGKEWIASFQPKERERTGISSLKVGFTRVFGYYIEVSKTNIDKVPSNYIRKQTIVNGERFITEELKVWEDRVLSAEEKQKAVEVMLFTELRKWLMDHLGAIQTVSDNVAFLDALVSFAETASANGFIRPEFTDGESIEIEDGRHPVIESLELGDPFVPNNTVIRKEGDYIHLITGPNMAGKSTYLRQTGLICLLAQVGSFVPAKSARLAIVDRIFTRVGASDRLAKGLSTFLVEMQELANILNNATSKSLVLLDEIGRGTSTFDGLSIAWALVEYIHEKIGAKTLFATHYHELTELPLILPGVKNYNVSVKEWNEEIIFLRKIVEGACDHSYGIQVARLAGVPSAVIVRAKEVLKNLETNELTPDQKPVIARHEESIPTSAPKAEPNADLQLTLFNSQHDDVISALRKLDVNALTPLQALTTLADLQKKIG